MEPTVGVGISNPYIQAGLLVISVLVVAFFSSAEASLISVNKFRIRHLAEGGHRAAQAVSRVVHRHDKFFATILLTENAAIIFASSVGTAMAISLLGGQGRSILIATLAMTALIVIFGEITPKTLAARAAERWALVIARPIEVIMTLESSLVYAFTLLPRLIIKLLGGQQRLLTPSITEGELRMLIDIGRAEGTFAHSEAEMLQNVFHFGDRQVREVMTPRTEVVWVEKGTSLGAFLELYARSPHSYFPVYHEHVDEVVGFLAVKDVLRAIAEHRSGREEEVTALARPAFFVPETKSIAELFLEMRGASVPMAVAVDEFGGVAGMVTLQGLIEEIVGPSVEEGATEEEELVALDANTFDVDGGLRLDDVNAKLGLALPPGDYETVAGFVLAVLGRIPQGGERVHHNDWMLEVSQVKGVKIERLRVSRLASARPGGA
ncbi:MAG: HlyC/CorC family transporter [Chloroflexi bacterium]|nr:HlyC/CorC family transporter [Chloroflexota bacterium]